MTAPLLTPAQLGDLLGLTAAEVDKLRAKNRWPHVRLSRFDVRFSEEDVAAIIASHHVVKPVKPVQAPAIEGQTSRSAARSAS